MKFIFDGKTYKTEDYHDSSAFDSRAAEVAGIDVSIKFRHYFEYLLLLRAVPASIGNYNNEFKFRLNATSFCSYQEVYRENHCLCVVIDYYTDYEAILRKMSRHNETDVRDNNTALIDSTASLAVVVSKPDTGISLGLNYLGGRLNKDENSAMLERVAQWLYDHRDEYFEINVLWKDTVMSPEEFWELECEDPVGAAFESMFDDDIQAKVDEFKKQMILESAAKNTAAAYAIGELNETALDNIDSIGEEFAKRTKDEYEESMQRLHDQLKGLQDEIASVYCKMRNTALALAAGKENTELINKFTEVFKTMQDNKQLIALRVTRGKLYAVIQQDIVFWERELADVIVNGDSDVKDLVKVMTSGKFVLNTITEVFFDNFVTPVGTCDYDMCCDMSTSKNITRISVTHPHVGRYDCFGDSLRNQCSEYMLSADYDLAIMSLMQALSQINLDDMCVLNRLNNDLRDYSFKGINSRTFPFRCVEDGLYYSFDQALDMLKEDE